MALIRKNMLKQALIVLRWRNRSVMTKLMIHDQNLFIRYQTKPFTHDKTLHPRPNRSPVTKYNQTVPQWPNHSTVTTMTNLFTCDQTVHRWPNRSNLTKPWPKSLIHDQPLHMCSNRSAMIKTFTRDQSVTPDLTFTHDQNIYLCPNRSPITKLFTGDKKKTKKHTKKKKTQTNKKNNNKQKKQKKKKKKTFIRDQIIQPCPNHSPITKLFTCYQTISHVTTLFTYD